MTDHLLLPHDDRAARPSPVARHLRRQFHRPDGPVGSVVGWILANRPSNVRRSRFLVDQVLELEPGHHVMELGPGPGRTLADAARHVTEGRLVAVDHSEVMLRHCADRNRELVADDRLMLVNADAQELPPDLVGFDRIWAMNVWHFWSDQEEAVVDLARRLAPGGRLVIGHQPRASSTGVADADAARRCLRDQMIDAGLEVDDRLLDLDPPAVFVLGRRG